MSRLMLFALCASVVAGPARGQTQLATFALPGPFGTVGGVVGPEGDFDGDGVNDCLVSGALALGVFSGKTGATLAAVPLPGLFPLGLVGVPDIDGDGRRDIVLGDGVSARAISSADGHVLWIHPGAPDGAIGFAIALLNDVDGDGFPDVAVGEPEANPTGLQAAGSIWVLSGDSGALIRRINGTAAHQELGLALAAAPDLDHDGRTDLFVGDSTFKVGGVQVGRVLVQSAFSGAVLESIPNAIPDSNFARVLANAGDLDGDGLDDVLVSASETDIGNAAFSTGIALRLWTDSLAPTSLAGVGDVNLDGVPDTVSGSAGVATASRAHVLAGGNGVLIQNIVSFITEEFDHVAPLGDTDGDGLPELLTTSGGAPFVPTPNAGLQLALPSGNVLHSLAGQNGGDTLGSVVDAVGDTDGDGVTDWMVASSRRLAIFPGAGGAALLDAKPDLLGVASLVTVESAGCTLGDVDGDGVLDVALGNQHYASGDFKSSGRVLLLSGATGAQLAVHDGHAGTQGGFGAAIAATSDHDGDGIRDLYVSAPSTAVNLFNGAGEVLLLSGATLQPLLTLHGQPQLNGHFGQSLDASGDLTGDGVPELAVGSFEESPGETNAGALYILDGVTHATLYHVDGADESGFVLGAITGDLDGDDRPDFVAAEPIYNPPGEHVGRGRIRAFSGATGALLWERTGPWPNSQFGLSVAGAGDVDGDGFADVAATLRTQGSATSPGTLALLSGVGGATLDQFEVNVPNDGTVIGPVHGAGLFDAGGCTDVIVGVPGFLGDGGAFVYNSSHGGVQGFTDLGFAKAGSNGATPSLHGYGDLAAGATVTLRARHALPFAPCLWFVGLAEGNLAFKQGTLVPDPGGLFLAVPLVTDGSGEVTITAPNPSTVFEGLSLYQQFWFSDAGVGAKASASNGMREIFK